MKAIQYTIRNIPEPVDRYLRKRSQISGRSLNQVIIDELSDKADVKTSDKTLLESLDWLIGSGMDKETLQALEDAAKAQKKIATRELKKNEDLGL